MNILFICKYNIVRSQIAEAFFNHYSSQHKAKSAGTKALYVENITLVDCAENVVDAMNAKGIHIAKKYPKPISEELVNEADKIVVLIDKSNLPQYVKNSDKVEYWTINTDFSHIETIRDEIEKKVMKFIEEKQFTSS